MSRQLTPCPPPPSQPVNGLGIMLTLLGGAGYAYIEFAEKQKKTRRLTEKN